MNNDELLQWVLDNYFSKWEIARVNKIRKLSGRSAALEELRRLSVQSWRGSGGPAIPKYETRPPLIRMWGPENTSYSNPPPIVIPIAKFCRLKLDNTHQISLF